MLQLSSSSSGSSSAPSSYRSTTPLLMQPLLLTTTSVIVVLIFCSVTVPTAALQVKSVQVPSHEVAGKPVKLGCEYDLEGDKLYTVKWYRGKDEFFRYVPGHNPEITVFERPGIFVDTAVSDSRTVSLRPVSLESSGTFKCEVSADAPSFHTASKQGNMLVVDLPDSEPTITGGRSRYHVGDEVHVNCTAARSRPAASLTWYINGEQADRKYTVQYAPEEGKDGLETSRLGLKFIAGARHFPNDQLKLRCTATITGVYWQESDVSMEGRMPQTGPALESKAVVASGTRTAGGSGSLLVHLLSLALMVLAPVLSLESIRGRVL